MPDMKNYDAATYSEDQNYAAATYPLDQSCTLGVHDGTIVHALITSQKKKLCRRMTRIIVYKQALITPTHHGSNSSRDDVVLVRWATKSSLSTALQFRL
jgi:hypothetical protein